MKNNHLLSLEPKLGGMPETEGLNFFLDDPNLDLLMRFYVSKDEYEKALPLLSKLGDVAGTELDGLSRDADQHPPVLVPYNRQGERVDIVKYHPAYHRMEEIGYGEFGLVAMSHRPGVMGWPTPFSRVLKYAFWYLFAQSEFGLCCPMSMTDSAARVIEQYASPEIKNKYLPRMLSTDPSEHWTGAQFMTEKQGGSDVGSNTVTAKKAGDHWELWGDKWFCSNVSADVALVLARPEGASAGTKGLAMFLVPKKLENGERNRFRINRLKDKLGTRDMASGEVTFEGAVGYVIGNLDSGFKQMMSMVNSSRLSNAVRSAAMMRRSFTEALVTVRGRKAFGQALIDLPLMRESLFELLLMTEAASSAIFYTAHVFDQAEGNHEESKKLLRILTPLLKGTVCKQARYVTAEAMEIRGGNGYIEEWVNPKLVRDAHVGSIWEGTTNIVALDVLRAIHKDDGGRAFISDLEKRLSGLKNAHVQRAAELCRWKMEKFKEQVDQIVKERSLEQEISAKRFMNRMYHLFTASLLLQEAEFQLSSNGGYRKLCLFIHYFQRYLHLEDDTGIFDKNVNEWLDAIIDWENIPENIIDPLLTVMENNVKVSSKAPTK
ncbi:acyl-CoA dehydrogenase family protein [Neobacillus citreus]|uniref:Acyl-CoA dehydrogenase family protein n=1 Tax=Neobacillus citreus TaxID=2833578 RepID=A0A942T6G1_9BACI|nr:acyl-CoA dehydrogenase family protein [Neobacillus citreus]MCH6265369.1 acyl-CoA dehydrogenase family protein [Neobacillus citreus]